MGNPFKHAAPKIAGQIGDIFLKKHFMENTINKNIC